MKALSLRQPWAHAVVHLDKTIENRRWPTRFRGEFLVHAAKGMTLVEYGEAVRFIARVKGWSLVQAAAQIPHPKALAFGGIVGRARLVDVIPPCGDAISCLHTWHMPEQYGFVLADVTPLPFVACKGMLGFWEVPANLLAKVGR